jgi:antitoxin HicB
MNKRSVDDYLHLPYTIEVVREMDPDQPGWVARVLELPGCITQGDDFEELGEMIEDAMRGWIEVALEDGLDIPEPRSEEDYSGKFVVRVPKSLHHRLVQRAEREGVSLNQFINVVLAGAVGFRTHEMAGEALMSYDETMEVISIAMRQVLEDASLSHPEIGAGDQMIRRMDKAADRLKFGVVDRKDEDYEQWLENAGVEYPPSRPVLHSRVLDDLMNE